MPDVRDYRMNIVIGELVAERGHFLFAMLDDLLDLRVLLLLNGIRREVRRAHLLTHVGLCVSIGPVAADALLSSLRAKVVWT